MTLSWFWIISIPNFDLIVAILYIVAGVRLMSSQTMTLYYYRKYGRWKQRWFRIVMPHFRYSMKYSMYLKGFIIISFILLEVGINT